YWLPRREQARGIALVLAGIPITSILGGPLSGFILDHINWLGLSSWRWLLILEGIPAVVRGLFAYLFLPGRPEESTFLSRDEKDCLIGELAREREQTSHEHRVSLAQSFIHPRVWRLGLTQCNYVVGFYCLSFWLPQIVKSLSAHYSNTTVGFLVVIPQLTGLGAMVLVSRSSDRHLERRYHAALAALVGGVGWLLLGTTTSPVASILLLSVI